MNQQLKNYWKDMFKYDKKFFFTFWGIVIFVSFWLFVAVPTSWFFRLTDNLCPKWMQVVYGHTGLIDNIPFHQEYLELEDVSDRSTAIQYVGYTTVQHSLGIVFQSNTDRLYVYSGVPKDTYKEFMRSESMGRYFTDYIEPGYDYTLRIDNYQSK